MRFLLKGAAGEQTADGDNLDMVAISFVLCVVMCASESYREMCKRDISFFRHASGILGPTMLIC
jgi:hypothetical protein